MANDINRALQYLNNADISSKQPALYQVIKTLIDVTRNTQAELDALVNPGSVSPGGVIGGFAPKGATYLTTTHQSNILPVSSVLLAGTNISFDDSAPNIRVVNSVGSFSGSSVTGIPGNDGEDGNDSFIPGPPGASGVGSPGPIGLTGLTGLQGISGNDGQDGEDSFIPGPIGSIGSIGPIGNTGSQGIQGISGNDGEDGNDSFIPGPIGLTGAQGVPGLQGIQGLSGLQGEDGNDGEQGFPGPSWNGGIVDNITVIGGSGNYAGSPAALVIDTDPNVNWQLVITDPGAADAFGIYSFSGGAFGFQSEDFSTTGTSLTFGPNGMLVESNARGAGAISGKVLSAGRNTSGNGSAGALRLIDRLGSFHYIWVDAAGILRSGSSLPTEDGSVSDVSGSIIQVGTIQPGPMGMPGDDGQDGQDSLIPGPQGVAGSAGIQGPQGYTIFPDDGEDGNMGYPGPMGLTGTAGVNGVQPNELLTLLRYAFQRIDFLESVLDVTYAPNDMYVPPEIELLTNIN